jgi:hypothetical protein
MSVHATVLLRSRRNVIIWMNASLEQALRLSVLGRGCCSFLAAPGSLLRNTRQDFPRTSRLLYHAAFVCLLIGRLDFSLSRRWMALWSAENGSVA